MEKDVFLNTLRRFGVEDYFAPQQVHSNRIKFIKGHSRKYPKRRVLGTDGLLTDEKNKALVILCADCIPLFLYEKEKKVVGLMHIGYKGLLKGIAKVLNEVMEENGVDIRKVHFFIGPHICGSCYTFESRKGKLFKYYRNGRLNLSKELISQLKAYKVSKIYDSPFCTYHQSELFFSYRNGDVNSRMLSLIMIK
jgi:hypothetical protein